MINEIKSIKDSLERLEHYERLSNQKYDAWEADPMNPDREAAADRAYELEYNEFVYTAYLISRFAGIDEKEARAMVKGKRDELKRILTA